MVWGIVTQFSTSVRRVEFRQKTQPYRLCFCGTTPRATLGGNGRIPVAYGLLNILWCSTWPQPKFPSSELLTSAVRRSTRYEVPVQRVQTSFSLADLLKKRYCFHIFVPFSGPNYTVFKPYLYRIYTVFIPYLYRIYTVFIPYLYRIYTVFIRSASLPISESDSSRIKGSKVS
jgi:hypothetical protein